MGSIGVDNKEEPACQKASHYFVEAAKEGCGNDVIPQTGITV
jgi:hypothetical protein